MGVLDIFYPRRCVMCDRVLALRQKDICSKCIEIPEHIGEDFCMKCGKPVDAGEEYCCDCKNKVTSFQCGRSTFLYNRDMRKSITRFKYHGRQEYASYYAKNMYEQHREWIEKINPDALIPVPIHKERYRIRGYNQAELLAVELGTLANLPIISDYLVRVENTLPQKELSAVERLQNLQTAFKIQHMELYTKVKCVIIIDDIYTTGSTLEACSQVMKEVGVTKVYFLCLCSGQVN